MKPPPFTVARTLGFVLALAWLALLIHAGFIVHKQQQPPDAAIVLEGDPQRIRIAARYATEHPQLPIYISSQPVFYDIYHQALADENQRIERFQIRTCAHDTVTNFTCVANELKAQGYRHVLIITSDTHIPRALTVGRIVLGRLGIAVSPLPVETQGRAPESRWRIVRDALRASYWAIFGRANS